MTGPLISCVMPVAGRREFIPGILACFRAQDYPNRELVVLDNGERGVCDLIGNMPGIVYRRFDRRANIGELRNVANELARGEYIAHWDSDDWYSPTRLSEQIRVLRQSARPATGYNVLPFADDRIRRAWLYRGSPGYACGTSLFYLRAAWAGHRFDKGATWGEDNAFIRALKGRLVSVAGASIVARIHGAGTSPRDVSCWEEIEYAGLARVGYPVVTEVPLEPLEGMAGHAEHAGRAHPAPDPDGSRDDDSERVRCAEGRRHGGRKLRSAPGSPKRKSTKRVIAEGDDRSRAEA